MVSVAILRAHAIGRPDSDDFGRKLLEVYDGGKGSLSELAERFGVSLGWAWKVSTRRNATRKRTASGVKSSSR